jgi:hypothetical protein
MNSMKTFDPEKRCRVHDELNDKIIEWLPRWATLYREYAVKHDEGVIAWDGLLLDGWTEVASSHCLAEDEVAKEPINGVEPELSEDDIQREQLGPRGVPGKESPAKMTPQRDKKTPKDVDQRHTK